MIAQSTTRVFPRIVTALLTLLLAAAAVFVSAGPAAAHDDLLSSDPADGTTVDTLPAELRLSFSAALLSDQGSTVVEVTDAAGTPLTAGTPEVDQNVVTQPLAGDATGIITVRWRVVSSDGHPVDGEFSFTVMSAPTPTPSSAATTSESVAPSPEASPSETPLVTTTVDDDAASPLPWVIGGLVVAAALGAVIALMAARARQGKEAAATRTAGRDDLGGR